MKLCQHIEAHHEDYGVALFVLPVVLAVFGAAAIVGLLGAWL
jgi:hypothetical protein